MTSDRPAHQRPPAPRHPPRLGTLLVEAGVISEAQLAQALREQSSWGGRLGQTLVALGCLDEATLAATVARQWALPLADLDRCPPSPRAADLLPVGLAERYGVLALGGEGPGGRIRVACIDPTNGDAAREIQRVTGRVPILSVVTPSQLDRQIRRVYYGEEPPAAPVADPRLNVTRHSLPPAAGEAGGPGGRLEAIEARLDAIEGLLRRIEAAVAGSVRR